jgi:hypothetical protein
LGSGAHSGGAVGEVNRAVDDVIQRLDAGGGAGHQHVVVLGKPHQHIQVSDVHGFVFGHGQRSDGDQ